MARKSKKRGNNEGSIYQAAVDKKIGRWRAAVSLGYKPDGTPNRKVIYGKTRAEVSAKMAELLDKSYKGLIAEPSKVTVAEYAQIYLTQVLEGKAANTARNYSQELKHAVRFIGSLQLQAVKPAHILSMVKRMKEDGWKPKPSKSKPNPEARPYSSRNVQKVLERLRAMFAQAVRHQLMYVNPCDAVQAPRVQSEPKGRILEPQEIKMLLGALHSHPMEPFFRLLLDTGLRKGEALGLTWDDIDLEAEFPKLSVTKAWSANKMTTPKTRRSRRRVPIPATSVAVLKVLKSRAITDYGANIGSTYVFGNPLTGKPFDVNSPNHALNRLCTELGLKPVRVHDFRRTYGSLLLSKGVQLEVVSERMGHSNPTITLNVYRHLFEKERDEGILDFSGEFGAQPLDAKKTTKRRKPSQS